MKKTPIFTTLILILLFSISCKKTVKETEQKDKFTVSSENINLEWTAYKTTDKIPVKGTFTQIDLKNSPVGESPKEVINDLKFQIPLNSVYSKDSIRDFKLKESFFGSFKNTSNITGSITLDQKGAGIATISMNGLSKEIPVSYVIEGNDLKINALINLDNWQAQAAIAALNEVCLEQHKAADGVSKTWNEVNVEVNIKTILKK